MNGSTKATPPLTLYFDGACALCRAEMAALKSADADNQLILLDCASEDFHDAAADRDGVHRESMLAAMHVRDAAGRWYVGIAAFEQIYATAGLHGVAAFLGRRRLRPWLDRGYAWLARNRHRLVRIGAAPVVDFALKRATARAARRRDACRSGGCEVR